MFSSCDGSDDDVAGEVFHEELSSVAETMSRVDIFQKDDDCSDFEIELIDVKEVKRHQRCLKSQPGNSQFLLGPLSPWCRCFCRL